MDVVKDRWFSRPSCFKLVDLPPLLEGFKVVKLRLNSELDNTFIRKLFGEGEAMEILSLPVGYFEHDDVLRRHYTMDGEYTVKSGYKVAMELKGRTKPSNPNQMISWWKKLWQLKLPPKVKVFSWKMCKG